MAEQKCIQLIFSNKDISTDEHPEFPSFVRWNHEIHTKTTPAYHGCEIPINSLVVTLQSFLGAGVQARADRRGYYTVGPAAYYTNSVQYSGLWPVIKSDLKGWRRLKEMPIPSILLVCSEPIIDDIKGITGEYTATIIPQEEIELVTSVSPSFSPSLTCEQYVTATKHPLQADRVPHEKYTSIDTCDLIIAPLPRHTQNAMQNSIIGPPLFPESAISDISILTAATQEGADYMSKHITKIVVFGWGEGRLGATSHVNFGSAGKRLGTGAYPGYYGL